MKTPLLTSTALEPGGLTGLDQRARDIFRRIVESYLQTGEPVGSRTLSMSGISLSPASISNTMQDLTVAGLLGSPHTSAGRIPTHAGLRLFVDGLLEIGDIGAEERREIDGRLAGRGRNFDEALNEASSLLSGLAGGASIVANVGALTNVSVPPASTATELMPLPGSTGPVNDPATGWPPST